MSFEINIRKVISELRKKLGKSEEEPVNINILFSGGIKSTCLLNECYRLGKELSINIHVIHIRFNDTSLSELVFDIINEYLLPSTFAFYNETKTDELLKEKIKDVIFVNTADITLAGYIDNEIDNSFKELEIIKRKKEVRLLGNPLFNLDIEDIKKYFLTNS